MVGNFRDELGKSFIAAGEEFPSLAVVTADVSKSTRSIEFKKRWPERFFSVGWNRKLWAPGGFYGIRCVCYIKTF